MKIIITRAAEGITLNNGIRETLMDEQNEPMRFDSEDAARTFLKEATELEGDAFEDFLSAEGVEFEQEG